MSNSMFEATIMEIYFYKLVDNVCVCFIYFYFFKVQIQREVGNREKRSDHGSQNREIRSRFARVPAFFT